MKIRLRSRCYVFCCALMLCAAACANSARAADFYRTRWALLIGVGQFRSPQVPPLQFCHNDVAAVRNLLTAHFNFPADHLASLEGKEATKGAIMRQLSRLSDHRLVAPDDAVLVYFSGHGQTVPLPRGGEMGFLIPYDADVELRDITNPAPYYDTCLGMDELRRLSALIPAKHVLFLVDACYSGLAVETRRDVPAPTALQTVAARPVRQIVVAGLKDEKAVESPAWKHGAFTYALLQGLETGAADFDQDGVVTGMELATYLRGAVPRLAPQTPQYVAFDGDGEYLFSRSGEQPSPRRDDLEPRIQLTDPPDLAGGAGVLDVRPVGDTVTLKGLVVGEQPISTCTLDGRALSLAPVTEGDLPILRRPSEREAARFEAQIKVEQGETKAVVLKARDAAGNETTRRLLLSAQAADAQPPEIRLTEVRTYDAQGAEVDWRGLTVASKGLTVASKALTTASKAVIAMPKEGHRLSLAGFARDDRAVVSVDVNERATTTRPASRSELEGLGWSAGVAFEGDLAISPTKATKVVIAACDAAGNKSSATLSLEPAAGGTPEVVILEPPQTRDIRGTGLLLPKGAATVQIAGLARAGSPILRIAVDGQPARTRPATPEELQGSGWPPPATYFTIEVPVLASGVTDGITVEVIEKEGGRTAVVVLLQRPGPPLEVQFSSDRPTYRVGEKVRLFMSCDRDAYVYIFHRELGDGLSAFLPNAVEPDCLLPGGIARVFPNPAKEARWRGEYGLLAQEPAGTDTTYCLALPRPLPASQLKAIANLDDLARTLAAAAPPRPTAAATSAAPREIAGLAKELGGSWQMLRYEVRK